jgi:hypothetical protein
MMQPNDRQRRNRNDDGEAAISFKSSGVTRRSPAMRSKSERSIWRISSSSRRRLSQSAKLLIRNSTRGYGSLWVVI